MQNALRQSVNLLALCNVDTIASEMGIETGTVASSPSTEKALCQATIADHKADLC